MAEYVGVEYDPDFYRGEDETMIDYMSRLEELRKLKQSYGSSLVTPPQEVQPETAPVLGQLTRNVNDGGVEVGIDTRTPREVFESAVRMKNYGLNKGQQIGVALTPFGGLFQGLAEKGLDTTIKGYIESLPPDSPERKEAEAFLSGGYGPMQPLDNGMLSSVSTPIDLASLFVDTVLGTNTAEQQAAIPVRDSVGTPANTSDGTAVPTVFNPRAIASSAGPSVVASMFGLTPIEQQTSQALSTGADKAAQAITAFANMDRGSSDPDTYAQSWGDAISAMEASYDFDSEYENF